MTQNLLVDIGEEYLITQNVDGVTLRIGLYNDSTDNISESDNVSAITSEPPNSNYSTSDVTFSAAYDGSNWGISNDTELTFDFSDTTDDTKEVDTAYILAQFDSAEAGTNDWHLITNPSLTQTRKIGSIDTLGISAGDLTINLD